MTSLGVVIVTHRSDEQLPGMLRELERHEPEAKVVVVDSGSPTGSPSIPSSVVSVIELRDNVGFGTAANRGCDVHDQPDTLAILNPDVRLQGPSLSQLADRLHQMPQIGIVTGPIVDGEGKPQPSAWGPTSPLRAFWFAAGWRLPRLRRLAGRAVGRGILTSAASLSRAVENVDGHVLGGAMIVRRECWEQLGGFDEEFFLYWEDADLCHRARTLGWRVAVLPSTPFIHVAGTSSLGVTDHERWQWYVDGADRYASKHLTSGQRRRLLGALRLGRRFARDR